MSADADTLRAMQIMLVSEVERLRADMQAMGDELAASQADALMEQRGDFVAGEDGGAGGLKPFRILPQVGLDIKIHPGTVNGLDPEYGATPLSDLPTVTLPDNATTHVFIKVDLTPGPPDPPVKYLYMVDDPVTVEIGASTPADTGISYADTAGTAYWTIAKVTTLSGEVTVIDQTWTGHLWYVWSNGGHLWAGRS